MRMCTQMKISGLGYFWLGGAMETICSVQKKKTIGPNHKAFTHEFIYKYKYIPVQTASENSSKLIGRK